MSRRKPFVLKTYVETELKANNDIYFHLSEDEITLFADLASQGEGISEEWAVLQLAALTKKDVDERMYWLAIMSFWGLVDRNSIQNNEDKNRKDKLTELFYSDSDHSNKFGNDGLPYNILVKTVFDALETIPDLAPVMAFGIFKETFNDYLFWDDLYASTHEL